MQLEMGEKVNYTGIWEYQKIVSHKNSAVRIDDNNNNNQVRPMKDNNIEQQQIPANCNISSFFRQIRFDF